MRKLVFGLILALSLLSLAPTGARADTVSDEAAFVAKINELRASKGVPPLVVNANLVTKARAWSAVMAAAGRIWHSTLSDGITEDWRKLGENVGMGGSVGGLHTAFVKSPHHYENLVDPAFGHVGIGIVMSGDTIFVTEVFMQLMPDKSTPATAASPATTVTTAPPATTTTTRPPVVRTTAPRPKTPSPTLTTARAPSPTTTTTTTTAPPVAAPPVDPPVTTYLAPIDRPKAPSALLVSVLERLRSFDS